MDGASSIVDVLSQEIIRKLRLGTEADLPSEDREIILEEIFLDITGQVDAAAREKLKLDHPACFYEVLAPHFLKHSATADTLLFFCKRLWNQPWVAPILALLLHRWLLLRPEAGGSEQRQKHINVLMLGSRQLFFGDVRSGIRKFAPLYFFLAHGVVLSPNRTPLDSLPPPAREGVLAVVAAYLPYYEPPEDLAATLEAFPSPTHTLEAGGHIGGEAYEFVVDQVTHTIPKVRSEEGLVAYLKRLQALGPAMPMRSLGSIARLRLQSELYSLTTPGGPYYAPPAVRAAALDVLDALFPLGRRSRRLVRLLFRWLHPADWLGSAALLWCVRMGTYVYAWMLSTLVVGLYRLLVRRQQR